MSQTEHKPMVKPLSLFHSLPFSLTPSLSPSLPLSLPLPPLSLSPLPLSLLLQWLAVQGLWHSLEAVFSSPATAREFPEEAVRFTATHGSWLTVMRRAHSTKNVIQVCNFNCLIICSPLLISTCNHYAQSLSDYLFTPFNFNLQSLPSFSNYLLTQY